MAPRYMSDGEKLLLTLTVLLMFVISTAGTKQSASKKTEGGDYIIRNIRIKMCQLRCAEHGQCVSIDCDIKTLTCRLSRDGSKAEKKEGHVTPASSNSHVPTGSCMCGFGQRCVKTRSGNKVCVQASKTLQPAPVTTQDIDAHTIPSGARNRNLLYASSRGDLRKVKRILAAGHVNINTRGGPTSITPVAEAARNRHWDVVKFLVGRGADVSLVNSDGNNVLHWACMGGHLETVKLILSLNVLDINARDSKRRTAAIYAASGRRQRLLALLLSRGGHF